MVSSRYQRHRSHGCGSPVPRGAWLVALVALPSVALASISTRALGPGLTATQLAAALMGDGVAVSNVRYTGAAEAAGVFGAAAASVGIERGVILSTGPVSGIAGPNTSRQFGFDDPLGEPGDTDLDTLIGDETRDAAVLEFDVVPVGSDITFSYVFASDEYSGEAPGNRDGEDDVFAVFVNNTNQALLPDGTTIISVSTVNGGFPLGRRAQNTKFFVDNTMCVPQCPFDFQADGKTVVLTLHAPVTPGVANHMKVAIGDATDETIDSWVFLQTKSFPHLVEDCTNHIDDDVDGLVDKQDPDCAVCGDGVLDPGEECDDGNVAAGDGCSPTCRVEHPAVTTTTTLALPPGDGCLTDSGAARNCDDGNPCTADSCDTRAGCVHDPAPLEGQSCDDGNACTEQDRCTAGTCTGSQISCDDGDACSADACDPSAGCTHSTVAADGAACDDGDPCTESDACGGGICAGDRVCGPNIPPGSERGMRNRVVKVPCTGTIGASCTIDLLPDPSGGRGVTASAAAAPAARLTKPLKPRKIRRTGVVVLKLALTGSGRKLLAAAPDGRLAVRARATLVSRDHSTLMSEVPFLLLSPRRRGGR
jgi:cysteine-rich repeat protein